MYTKKKNISIKELKAKAKGQIKGKVFRLFLVSVVVYLIPLFMELVPVIGNIAATLVLTLGIALGTATIYLSIANGGDPQAPEVFGQIKNF